MDSSRTSTGAAAKKNILTLETFFQYSLTINSLLGGGASVGSGSHVKFWLHKLPSQQQKSILFVGLFDFSTQLGLL